MTSIRFFFIIQQEEMVARYEDGTLEEGDSWQDLQRLDHLEYEHEHLVGII